MLINPFFQLIVINRSIVGLELINLVNQIDKPSLSVDKPSYPFCLP